MNERTVSLRLSEAQAEELAEVLDQQGGFDDLVEYLLEQLVDPSVPEQFRKPGWEDTMLVGTSPIALSFQRQKEMWWALRDNGQSTYGSKEFWQNEWPEPGRSRRSFSPILVFYQPNTKRFVPSPDRM